MHSFHAPGAVERKPDKKRGPENFFALHAAEIAAVQAVVRVVPEKEILVAGQLNSVVGAGDPRLEPRPSTGIYITRILIMIKQFIKARVGRCLSVCLEVRRID